MFSSDKNIEWITVKAQGLGVVDRGSYYETTDGALIFWGSQDAHTAQAYLQSRLIKPIELKMDTAITDILKECTVEGMVVKLPARDLGAAYNGVKAALNKIGGFWKGGEVQGFVFKEDPTSLLAEIAGGTKRNIKQEYQFFHTPKDLGNEMVRRWAAIEEGMTILEPSAGQGHLIEIIYNEFPYYMKGPNDKPGVTISYYELMPLNANIISDKIQKGGVRWTSSTSCMGTDFLAAQPEPIYDRIIANPPFTKNQDIDHIYHMWKFLKPGGRIVTVSSKTWVIGNQKKQKEFRQWLRDVHAQEHDLPVGTFKESGTMAGAMLLVIDKPE